MKITYKDFIILFLITTQLLLIFYITFKTENTSLNNDFLKESSNLTSDRKIVIENTTRINNTIDIPNNTDYNYTDYNNYNFNNTTTLEYKVNSKNITYVSNSSNTPNTNDTNKTKGNLLNNNFLNESSNLTLHKKVIKENNIKINTTKINISNNTSYSFNNSVIKNTTTLRYKSQKNNKLVKNIPLEKLFMDLPYSNVIEISENGKEGIIKTYKKDGIVINFDVRNYKPNLDNPRYVNVSKEKKFFQYGIYYKYTYIVQYNNITSISYCYYRNIGKYHIIMGFNREDESVRDMWLRWNEYIENLT